MFGHDGCPPKEYRAMVALYIAMKCQQTHVGDENRRGKYEHLHVTLFMPQGVGEPYYTSTLSALDLLDA